MKQVKKIAVAIVLLAVFALFVNVTYAADAPAQEPFTKAELDKFLADYPEFAAWAQKAGNSLEDVDSSQEVAAAMQYNKEIQEYLEGKGWTADRFFYVLSHIGMGLMRSAMGDGNMSAADQLQMQRDMIANNPAIPENDKKEALAELDEAIAETRKNADLLNQDIPEEELALILANKDKIMEVMTSGN